MNILKKKTPRISIIIIRCLIVFDNIRGEIK